MEKVVARLFILYMLLSMVVQPFFFI